MGGSRKVNFRMTTILRLLLLSTFLVSCLSAPKFHLIETEDEDEDKGGEEGAVSNQEIVWKMGKVLTIGTRMDKVPQDGPTVDQRVCRRHKAVLVFPNARIASDYQFDTQHFDNKTF